MRIATAMGFSPPVLVDVAKISIDDHKVQEAIGPLWTYVLIDFSVLVTDDLKLCSATYRLFKVAAEDTRYNVCEVLYKGVVVSCTIIIFSSITGTIPDCPIRFNLAYDTTLSVCVLSHW